MKLGSFQMWIGGIVIAGIIAMILWFGGMGDVLAGIIIGAIGGFAGHWAMGRKR